MSYYKEDIFPEQLSYSFFIFSTLGTTHPKQSREAHGWQQANDLRNQALSKLNSFKLTPNRIKKQEQILGNIKTALDFLKQAAEQEASRESNFFNKLLSNPRIANVPQLKELKACFSGDGTIDYDQFMLLIQEIDRGEQGGKKLINSLYRHTKSFNDILQENLMKPKNVSLREKYEAGDIDQVIHELFSDETSGMQEKFKRSSAIPTGRVRTLAAAIKGSQRAGPDTKKLVSFFQSNISELESKNYISIPLDNSEYKDTYRAQILIELEAIAKEILQDEGNINPKVSETSQKAIQLLQTILQEDKKGIEDKSLKPYLEQLKINIKRLESGKELLEELNQLTSASKSQIQYNSKTQKLVGFIQERRKQLLRGFEEVFDKNDKTLKELRKIEETGNFRKPQVQAKYQALIKTALRKYYKIAYGKKTSGSLSNERMAQLACDILTKDTQLTISLQSEFGAGITLDELIDKSAAKIFSNLIGNKNQKADLRQLIHIGEGIITIDGEEMDMNSILKILSEVYENTYDNAYQEGLQTARESIKQTFGNARKEYFNSESAYSYDADKYAREKSLQAMTTELENLLSSANEEYDSKTLKEIVSNLFSMEQSVKGYQYYIDEKGFHGGSIGATIFEQVENICQIAADAGINIDPQWLLFAAFNAGEHLLAAKLAPNISAYFSIFASLLMFSSAGDLFAQVKKNADEFVSSLQQTSLRIYNFNRMVVLNSYLLHKTYEALLPAYALLENQVVTSNKVVIHNTVGYDTYNAYPEHWNGAEEFDKFSEIHKEDVSISTELLVGFLGILDKLETMIQNSPI